MSAVQPCPGCGVRLMPSDADVGLLVRCPSCRHRFVLRRPEALTEGDDVDGRGTLPEADGPRAVPAPRASRSSREQTQVLALAAIGIFVPLVAPLAWWLASRESARLRVQGGEVPSTTRTSVALGIVGSCELIALLCCGAPFLLFA